MSGVSALFFFDSRGKSIITRCYRYPIPPDVTETFHHCVINQDDCVIKPIFSCNGCIYCWIKHQDIYVVALTLRNANCSLIITFLHRLVDVLKSYFKVLKEESLRNNFVVTYDLLDEIMDAGYPQTTDSNIIRAYIKNQAHQLIVHEPPKKIPACVTSTISWRPEGIKHKRNEVYLDVIEKLNMLISSTGSVLKSEILGFLKMKTYLTGMPLLRLGLNDKVLLDMNRCSTVSTPSVNSATSNSLANHQKSQKFVELEDIQFHQCVRLNEFTSDRTISFIPPDGEFTLMSYRLTSHTTPIIWVECSLTQPSSTASRLSYSVKAKSNFRPRSIANNVEIHIPVPANADTPIFKVSIGCINYYPEKNSMIWSIRYFQGQAQHVMSATFGFPSTIQEPFKHPRRPISVHFEIPYTTVSCMTVRFLKVVEKSGYQALPWVRYMTRNGDYFIRIN